MSPATRGCHQQEARYYQPKFAYHSIKFHGEDDLLRAQTLSCPEFAKRKYHTQYYGRMLNNNVKVSCGSESAAVGEELHVPPQKLHACRCTLLSKRALHSAIDASMFRDTDREHCGSQFQKQCRHASAVVFTSEHTNSLCEVPAGRLGPSTPFRPIAAQQLFHQDNSYRLVCDSILLRRAKVKSRIGSDRPASCSRSVATSCSLVIL